MDWKIYIEDPKNTVLNHCQGHRGDGKGGGFGLGDGRRNGYGLGDGFGDGYGNGYGDNYDFDDGDGQSSTSWEE